MTGHPNSLHALCVLFDRDMFAAQVSEPQPPPPQPQPPPPQPPPGVWSKRLHTSGDRRFLVFRTLAVAMDGERGSGAALRRRERRLRAWQRHVRTAVQLALAEKFHHSANKVEPDNALRGQEKRAGREEAGLAPVSEVAGPQRCDRTLRGTSLGAPSLAAPQLAANETLDSSALSFLLNLALEEKEKEEEERRKKEEEQVKRQEDQEEALLKRLQAEWDALLALGAVLDEREAILDRRERRRVVPRRKRKKKRRKRTRRSRCTR